MNSELSRAQAGGELFSATLKGGGQSTESMNATLGAARAAAQELTETMREKKRRAKKRRQKREAKLIAAAEKAAAEAGINFTGTMKQRALASLATGAEDDYADDGFEADEGEQYDDDFEEEAAVAAAAAPAAKARKSGKPKATPSSSPAGGLNGRGRVGSGSGMEAISINADAGFEATVGGTKRKKGGKGRKEKDVFSDTYSRAGLPGRRAADSDDDVHTVDPSPLAGGGDVHHRRNHSLADEQLPALGRAPSSGAPTGRGLSPHSSPGTSNYLSDASNSQLPSIAKRR